MLSRLNYATIFNSPQVVALLIDEGCDIDEYDETGFNALQTATERGYDAIITLLLTQGAKVDTAYWGSTHKYTPLYKMSSPHKPTSTQIPNPKSQIPQLPDPPNTKCPLPPTS